MSDAHVSRRLSFRDRTRPAANARVLLIAAHPALYRSRVNARLLEEARALEGVTVHDLYDAYPDFDIVVAHEKELLLAHDVVVLQHPFYWYSAPALLKQWLDLVLEFNWAYGPEGKALVGKVLLTAVTTGAREETYTREGFNRFTVRELLAPIEQTARLCGLRFLAPFVVHATHRLGDAEIEEHAKAYGRVLAALREDTLDVERLEQLHRLNADLERTLAARAGTDEVKDAP